MDVTARGREEYRGHENVVKSAEVVRMDVTARGQFEKKSQQGRRRMFYTEKAPSREVAPQRATKPYCSPISQSIFDFCTGGTDWPLALLLYDNNSVCQGWRSVCSASSQWSCRISENFNDYDDE